MNHSPCASGSLPGLVAGWADHGAGGVTEGFIGLAGVVTLVDLQSNTTRTISCPFVPCLAFSPDSRTLAIGGSPHKAKTGEIVLIDRDSGKETRRIQNLHAHVNSVAFSSDGRLLVSGGGKRGERTELRVWDVARGRTIVELRGHGDQVNAVAFSPDGRRLASGDQAGMILIWDASDWYKSLTNEVKLLEVQTFRCGHARALTRLRTAAELRLRAGYQE